MYQWVLTVAFSPARPSEEAGAGYIWHTRYYAHVFACPSARPRVAFVGMRFLLLPSGMCTHVAPRLQNLARLPGYHLSTTLDTANCRNSLRWININKASKASSSYLRERPTRRCNAELRSKLDRHPRVLLVTGGCVCYDYRSPWRISSFSVSRRLVAPTHHDIEHPPGILHSNHRSHASLRSRSTHPLILLAVEVALATGSVVENAVACREQGGMPGIVLIASGLMLVFVHRHGQSSP